MDTERILRKRYYIMLVARNSQGELLKIPIPVHYVYVLITGALIGILTIAGMAVPYTRMLVTGQHFNKLRDEKDAFKTQYSRPEQIGAENQLSLTSLGGEVSSLNGLRPDPAFGDDDSAPAAVEQFYALRTTAMTGAASVGINSMVSDDMREASTHDWMGVAAVPTLWPVQGRITASYGERIDPFSGEGAFHRGIDIASEIGTRIVAPADGVVKFSDLINGYGRAVIIDHGNGVSTLYGHLSGFAVSAGQLIHRGDTLGYVGQSGRSTGPHLHYEVRVLNNPVNPYKYLRLTLSQQVALGAM